MAQDEFYKTSLSITDTGNSGSHSFISHKIRTHHRVQLYRKVTVGITVVSYRLFNGSIITTIHELVSHHKSIKSRQTPPSHLVFARTSSHNSRVKTTARSFQWESTGSFIPRWATHAVTCSWGPATCRMMAWRCWDTTQPHQYPSLKNECEWRSISWPGANLLTAELLLSPHIMPT